jgi:hypothetical protein
VKVDLVYKVNVDIYLILWKLLGNTIKKLNNVQQKEFLINLKLKHYQVVEEKNIEHLFN